MKIVSSETFLGAFNPRSPSAIFRLDQSHPYITKFENSDA